jgi:hypothetical protein
LYTTPHRHRDGAAWGGLTGRLLCPDHTCRCLRRACRSDCEPRRPDEVPTGNAAVEDPSKLFESSEPSLAISCITLTIFVKELQECLVASTTEFQSS